MLVNWAENGKRYHHLFRADPVNLTNSRDLGCTKQFPCRGNKSTSRTDQSQPQNGISYFLGHYIIKKKKIRKETAAQNKKPKRETELQNVLFKSPLNQGTLIILLPKVLPRLHRAKFFLGCWASCHASAEANILCLSQTKWWESPSPSFKRGS